LDPGERNNLAADMPQKVEQLKVEYESWIEENSGKY
jgi:hypothetical protein